MPYARVGVIPQASPNNDRQSSQQRSGRKQGITMGDLKKQTALRLAQEQQQTRFFPNLTQRKDEVVLLDQHTFPRGNFTDPRQPPHQALPMQPGIVYPVTVPITNNQSAYGSENSHRQQMPQQGAAHKSKLPHGLTVQELKEMTKARLQAENRHETDLTLAPISYQPKQHYPVTQPHRHDPRGSPYGDHRRGMNRGYQQEHLMAAPIATAPPGFQSLPSQASLVSASEVTRQTSWQQHQLEAWETGSVDTHNSTINSDYLGSENAFTSDEFGDMPFNCARPYPATQSGFDRQFEGHGNSSYFDHMNTNRRRSVTMSPRTMAHLYEDRPSCGTASGLKIPFDSPPHDLPAFRPVPLRDDGLADYTGVSRAYNGQNSSFSFNRPRTASAPSVSSSTFISQTGDMFGEANGLSSLSQGLANDDLPKSMVESLLGGSSITSRETDFSRVFRNTSQDGKNPWGTDAFGGGISDSTHSNDTDSSLARELGAVLSLSGIENPSDNDFVGNNDQVSLFQSLGGSHNNGTVDQKLHGIYGNNSSYATGDLGQHSRDQGY